jgi:hypothetical protein
MPDACETFVRWYVRFNGYLGVENFIVHEPRAGRVNQGTESDILAVRFPYSQEDPGTAALVPLTYRDASDARSFVDRLSFNPHNFAVERARFARRSLRR